MKRNFTLTIALFFSILTMGQTATVFFDVQTEKKRFFQSESDLVTGYLEVTPGTVQTIELTHPAYYYYVDGKSNFHTLFLTPGAKERIVEKEGVVTFEGDNAAVNRYMQQHPALVSFPAGIDAYSVEGIEYQCREVEKQIKDLQASGLPEAFVRLHTIYYRSSYRLRLMTGPETVRMFQGKQLDLPVAYYADAFANRYDDADLLAYPKWFTLMRKDLELREQMGVIRPDHRNFITRYAACIGNEEVKSAFLLRYLELTLKAGYSEEFRSYLKQAREAVKQPSDAYLSRLAELEKQYDGMRGKVEKMTRGNDIPAFVGVDVNGKEYSSEDYAGKVWVLDFWFSGCVPCKAEMPFMEKLAEEFKDKDIQFFALSLDSGDQLMRAWKKMVKEKNGAELQLNIPQGFRSPLARHFGIRSVPRIIVVDKNGKIVDAFARRPSDPKLRELLLELLEETDRPKLTKEEATQAMVSLSRAATANEKEAIMKNFVDRVKREKADFAYPMANMMVSLTVEALYVDGQKEKADKYMTMFAESPFKRDIYFMAGAKCAENGNWQLGEELMGEAARMTLKLNDGKELTEEEQRKYPVMFGLYSEALIRNNHVAEAVPYARLAYEQSVVKDFRLNHCYAATLVHEKNYKEAAPILEELISNGTGDAKHEAWLEECYTALKGSDRGFDKYLGALRKSAVKQRNEELAKQMVNEPAPAFALKNLKGETCSLESLKGKVVVLDFWATWCGPCKASFPAMQKALNYFSKDKDVEFLFINTLETKKNHAEVVAKYMADNHYSFNVLFDTPSADKKYPVVTAYGPKGIPAKYIIDKNGNIRFKVMGFSGSDEETVEELKAMVEMAR